MYGASYRVPGGVDCHLAGRRQAPVLRTDGENRCFVGDLLYDWMPFGWMGDCPKISSDYAGCPCFFITTPLIHGRLNDQHTSAGGTVATDGSAQRMH